MLVYTLALISFFGFVASLLMHILALFGYANPTLTIFSFILLLLAIVLVWFGVFTFPSSITTTPGWGFRKMGNNFCRPIPKKGVLLIRLAAIYGFGAFFVAVLFANAGNDLAWLIALTSLLIAVYGFHSVSYWYHSPVEIRDDFMSMFKSTKHLKRHRKHDDLSKT